MKLSLLPLIKTALGLLVFTLFTLGNFSAQNWYLPDTTTGPAVNAATAPVGYVEANSCCVQAVVDADPYCLETNWDFICQAAYDGCMDGCIDDTACNYHPLASECFFPFPGPFYTCTYPKWHIPAEPNSTGVPAVFQCTAPEGYITPADQCCLEHITAEDSFCTETSWDSLCQSRFEGCVEGCADVTACNYSFFAACSNQAESNAACIYEEWYLPDDDTTGPAFFGCFPPEGYEPAETCCIEWVFSQDAYCEDNDWDVWCFIMYYDCLSGCSDSEACNYDPVYTCSIGCQYEQWYIPEASADPFIPIFSCEAPEGYFPTDAVCFDTTVSNFSCDELGWDPECVEAYFNCTNVFGCTDENACNYNEYSTVNDGSCEGLKGCTNELTENYNPDATCDDGTCILTIVGGGCPGDFNADGFVTTTDLSGFLAAFGSECPQ